MWRAAAVIVVTLSSVGMGIVVSESRGFVASSQMIWSCIVLLCWLSFKVISVCDN